MKYLTDRKEIAKAINFGKYPVLELNISDCVPGYNGLFKGSDVRVACTTTSHGTLYANCTLTYERTEDLFFPTRIDLTQGGVCLKNSFGYSDIMEMKKWANTPILNKGQEVVVILNAPSVKTCIVAIYKVSDKVDLHCMTVATLEEIVE